MDERVHGTVKVSVLHTLILCERQLLASELPFHLLVLRTEGNKLGSGLSPAEQCGMALLPPGLEPLLLIILPRIFREGFFSVGTVHWATILNVLAKK